MFDVYQSISRWWPRTRVRGQPHHVLDELLKLSDGDPSHLELSLGGEQKQRQTVHLIGCWDQSLTTKHKKPQETVRHNKKQQSSMMGQFDHFWHSQTPDWLGVGLKPFYCSTNKLDLTYLFDEYLSTGLKPKADVKNYTYIRSLQVFVMFDQCSKSSQALSSGCS